MSKLAPNPNPLKLSYSNRFNQRYRKKYYQQQQHQSLKEFPQGRRLALKEGEGLVNTSLQKARSLSPKYKENALQTSVTELPVLYHKQSYIKMMHAYRS